MTHWIVEIAVRHMEQLYDLQRRVLDHELDRETAAYEMREILGYYMPHLPEDGDTTEFVLLPTVVSKAATLPASFLTYEPTPSYATAAHSRRTRSTK